MDKITIKSINTDQVQTPKVRQCILSARKNSSGYNNMLSQSSGQVTLNANTTDCVLTWANGWDGYSEVNYLATITSDQSPAGWNLSTTGNGVHYLYIDNDGNGNLTYGSTRKAPYYGYNFPSTMNSLLHFEGANGSTTITDSITGNTWAASGTAQISTAAYKFGTSSLKLAPGVDFIYSGNVELGDTYGWTFECWINITVGGNQCIFSNVNSDFGIRADITAAGQVRTYISSNGTGWDVANAITSSVGPVVTTVTFFNYCNVSPSTILNSISEI